MVDALKLHGAAMPVSTVDAGNSDETIAPTSPEEMAAHCEANGDVKFGMTGSSGTASMTSHKLNAIYHGRTSSPVEKRRNMVEAVCRRGCKRRWSSYR